MEQRHKDVGTIHAEQSSIESPSVLTRPVAGNSRALFLPMRIFVPDQFKHKGQGWKRPLTKKEKLQLAKYFTSHIVNPYPKNGQVVARY